MLVMEDLLDAWLVIVVVGRVKVWGATQAPCVEWAVGRPTK